VIAASFVTKGRPSRIKVITSLSSLEVREAIGDQQGDSAWPVQSGETEGIEHDRSAE
jgi:hypothetical protein